MKENQLSADSLMNILENIQGGVVLCDFDMITKAAKVTYTNRGWTQISGYTLDQLNEEKNADPLELIFDDDKAENKADFARQLSHGNTYEMLFRILHRNGEIRWVVAKGIIRPISGSKVQIQSILTEVTEIKEHEERMALLAQTDQLTGLNNKATFTLLAQNALNRRSENRCALLMLDIDSFKSINDTYGHDFGDKVLTAVGQRMKSFFRSGDVLGRVGCDEFMVLMTDVASEEAVVKKTRELCTAVRGIKILGDKHKTITVSIGVTLFMGGKPFETMFTEADTALYSAKDQGKNQYCIWRETEKIEPDKTGLADLDKQ